MYIYLFNKKTIYFFSCLSVCLSSQKKENVHLDVVDHSFSANKLDITIHLISDGED
jgi:hypothetical protein